MEAAGLRAAKGRPREFCVDQALAGALRVFWSKGYEGASLADLTDAMGITRPSLYAAFGNKEALFRKALDLYEREKLAYTVQALDAPTARGVAERLLRGALEMQASDREPRGCLHVIMSVACGAEAESVREEVITRRQSSTEALVKRFDKAKAADELPDQMDAEDLAAFLSALVQGFLLQAGIGTGHKELERLVATSLAVWPTP